MSKVTIDNLANTVMKGLEEYSKLATRDLKSTVKKSADTVRNRIKETAPKRYGKYQKSWAIKKERDTANSLKLVVHSKNRYQLAHLLEYGHVKRNGGRVSGKPHIAPAEQEGIQSFEKEITRLLKE